MKKAQSSTEFVILITFMLIVFLGFIYLLQTKMNESISDKEDLIAEDIASKIIGEIRLAESVSDNYNRTFTLPSRPEGLVYTVSILGDPVGAELTIKYGQNDKEKVFFLDSKVSIASTIKIGNNIITKDNGVITITSS